MIFDRSWYNRAGVEYVMGFCTKEQHKRFLQVCPEFEKQITDNGIRLIKYWLEVSNDQQKERFEARVEDPHAAVEAQRHGPSLARAVVRLLPRPRQDAGSDRHRLCALVSAALGRQARARLNLISHFLGLIPYETVARKKVKLPTRDKSKAYDDDAAIKDRRWIKEKF